MKMAAYPADISADDGGRVVVTFPDFGWGGTDGATLHEALLEAEDCLAEMIASTIDDGDDLPEPSAPSKRQVMIYAPVEIAAKAALYTAVRMQKIKTVDLARCLSVNEKEARRMLNPHHKTKLPRLEEALRAVGKRMVLSFEDDEKGSGKRKACA